MTSRILHLLQCMGPRAARTSTAANSWANVSLWRRFFEERDMEEEEQLEIITDTLVNLLFENDHGADANMRRPIDGEETRQARQSFVRDYYRTLNNNNNNSGSGSGVDPVMDRLAMAAREARQAQQERRRLDQPNLGVPVGREYVFRAQ